MTAAADMLAMSDHFHIHVLAYYYLGIVHDLRGSLTAKFLKLIQHKILGPHKLYVICLCSSDFT